MSNALNAAAGDVSEAEAWTALWREHGGERSGNYIEASGMPLANFHNFCAALLAASKVRENSRGEAFTFPNAQLRALDETLHTFARAAIGSQKISDSGKAYEALCACTKAIEAHVSAALRSAPAEQDGGCREALRLFREFVIQNATQWKVGHNHPIWTLVAEALGPVDDIRSGPDWQFIQPENTTPRALPAEQDGGWLPIGPEAETGRKVLGGCFNALGNWREVTARYYAARTLETENDDFADSDGYAPAGWYEESETHDVILPIRITHWQPLPPAPPRSLASGSDGGVS